MAVSITVPTIEPEKVTAGDVWTWKKSLTDYLPSENWTLTYALVKDGTLIEITASDDSDIHLVEIAAATTAGYSAGIYHYQAYVTNSSTSERYQIGTGTIEVLPNFATQSLGYDNRTHVKKTLDALEAVILGKASKDQLSYSIAGRSLSRMSPQELIDWRNQYRAEYYAEERKAGRKQRSIIRVKFNG